MKTQSQLAGWTCVLLALAGCPEMGGVTDAGTDAGSDQVVPRVVRTEPAHQSAGAAINSTFLVQFSEPMNTALVTVTLSPSSSIGVGTWNARKDTVTFSSPAALRFDTLYTLEVSGEDLAGNALSYGGSTFSTEAIGVDAGPADAGPPDAGPPDAGEPDAGTPDGGPASGWDVITWDVATWQ